MNKVIAFVLGAAAGSLVTWKLIEKKYKQIADEEIASVVEQFKNRDRAASGLTTDRTAGLNLLDGDVTTAEYKNILDNSGYTTDDVYEPYEDINDDSIVEVEVGEEKTAPYTISPEEFGEKDGFDTKSWTLYSDYVLTDEIGEIVSDPDSIIGDALTRFGEYEDDSVYVRNENIDCDYEILKHTKTFSEVNGR